jgi:F-type H+-transporting ATPase subunit alpha
MPVELQVVSIFAVANGYTDKLDVAQVLPFEEALHRYLLTSQADLMKDLRQKAELDKDITDRLKKALATFVDQFLAGNAVSLNGTSNGVATTGKAAQKNAQTHANAA